MRRSFEMAENTSITSPDNIKSSKHSRHKMLLILTYSRTKFYVCHYSNIYKGISTTSYTHKFKPV